MRQEKAKGEERRPAVRNNGAASSQQHTEREHTHTPTHPYTPPTPNTHTSSMEDTEGCFERLSKAKACELYVYDPLMDPQKNSVVHTSNF